MKAPGDVGQSRVRHVLDMRAPGLEALNDPCICVHTGDLVALLAEGDHERQADVPEPDDPDLHSRSV